MGQEGFSGQRHQGTTLDLRQARLRWMGWCHVDLSLLDDTGQSSFFFEDSNGSKNGAKGLISPNPF
jgi:hypothetical protein